MNRHSTFLIVGLLAAAVPVILVPESQAQIPPMEGFIRGQVNGQNVNFSLRILLDETTGEETAEVGNMSPQFGAIMRPVTAMVTIGGPTGGLPTGELEDNLFSLSGGVFTNQATMYWPATQDTLDLVHTTSFDAVGNYRVEATINGTVPTEKPDGSGPITLADAITIEDFEEVLIPIDIPEVAGIVTGAGYDPPLPWPDPCRSIFVGGIPLPGCKGSRTTYNGPLFPGNVIRSAEQISTTYDPISRTMNVHLFNFLSLQVLPGDFNNDGVYDCTDIDSLVAEIVAGTNTPSFDLNGDAIVDINDRDAWLAEAGAANLPSGNPYLLGDANLDGFVDGGDFNVWNSNKFTQVAAWCSGDFSADGVVDGADFGIWNSNKFLAADQSHVVPEPVAILAYLLLVTIHIVRRERDRV